MAWETDLLKGLLKTCIQLFVFLLQKNIWNESKEVHIPRVNVKA